MFSTRIAKTLSLALRRTPSIAGSYCRFFSTDNTPDGPTFPMIAIAYYIALEHEEMMRDISAILADQTPQVHLTLLPPIHELAKQNLHHVTTVVDSSLIRHYLLDKVDFVHSHPKEISKNLLWLCLKNPTEKPISMDPNAAKAFIDNFILNFLNAYDEIYSPGCLTSLDSKLKECEQLLVDIEKELTASFSCNLSRLIRELATAFRDINGENQTERVNDVRILCASILALSITSPKLDEYKSPAP